MKKRVALVCCCLAVSLICQAQDRKPPESGHAGQSSADHLPAHITRVTGLVSARIGRMTASGFCSWKKLLAMRMKLICRPYFSDYAGYKASNPVVSDDGRLIAFQMAKSK